MSTHQQSHSNSLASSPQTDTNFLDYGKIEVVGVDKNKRKAVLRLTLPFILLNTVTPVMLGCGKMGNLKLSPDLAVWQPELEFNEFKESVSKQCSDIKIKAWKEISDKTASLLRAFIDVAAVLKDVGDLINVLPIGTYVEVDAICDIDELPSALEELQKSSGVKGVYEFQFALAAALNKSLSLID